MSVSGTSSAFAERVERDDRVDTDLTTPGDHRIDTSITCVLTRFHLDRARDLIGTRRDYRAVLDEAQGTPGLLASAFLVEDLHTCFSLSIWDSPDSIPKFGTNVPAHVRAARRVFGRAAVDASGGAGVWSTKWGLRSVSNNLSWEGFDLRSHLDQGSRGVGRR